MSRGPKTYSRDSARTAQRNWCVVLVVWLAVIWGHSLVAGPESAAESNFIVDFLQPLFGALGVTDVDTMSFVVRKCAHFSEYAILGVIVANNLRVRGIGKSRAVLLHVVAAAVPIVDESIQLFSAGRDGNPRDVLIDCAGLALGSLLAWLWFCVSKRMADKEARPRS